MTISLSQFNQLSPQAAKDYLLSCCTSERWAQTVIEQRPFDSIDALVSASDEVWATMGESDFLQAFEGHPQIGNVETLKEKYRHTLGSASHEQSAVSSADDATLHALAKGNQDYLNKFGFIFIVFATGKSAQQMLDLLLARLPNNRDEELANAAAEQNKITQLRLSKLITE